MEINEAILLRRSIRKYKDTKISDEIITSLLVSAMAAPSACNKTPWEFYVIKDQKMNELLEDNTYFNTYKCPLKIVVCGNKDYFMENDRKEYWVQDSSAAIENIMLSALSYNLGTCWCGVYPVERRTNHLIKIMNLPSNIVPLGIILVGYPDETKEARSQYDENKVHII